MSKTKIFQNLILVILTRPMETKEICSKIKDQVPNECDDSVPCVHRGRFYGGPEWEHQVRNAQQILKRKRKIHLEGKKWSCFERQV